MPISPRGTKKREMVAKAYPAEEMKTEWDAADRYSHKGRIVNGALCDCSDR